MQMIGSLKGKTKIETGYSGHYDARRSPLGLGGTIAVHALVVGAFLLIPKEAIQTVFDPPPLKTKNIPLSVPPEPIVEPKADPRIQSDPQPQPKPPQSTAVDPIIPIPTGDPVLTGGIDTGLDQQPVIIVPPIAPPRAPVEVDARIDPRALSEFQPDYPGVMIRQGVEGSVTVRVAINAQGRVTAIEKISASDESFWLATQRHALRSWRFKPATRDGVAVASSETLTVRFTLTK